MKSIILIFTLLGFSIIVYGINSRDSNTSNKASSSESHDETKDEHGHGEEDEHGHGSGEKVGVGKAIEEVHAEKGFKLSNEAFSLLGIKLNEVETNSVFIEAASLVTSKNKTGVYRYRDGFFKLVRVRIKNKVASRYLIEAPDLRIGDKIVSDGVGLVAITDVYSTDTAEYGHGH